MREMQNEKYISIVELDDSTRPTLTLSLDITFQT